jgi:hypothetical protein
MTEFSHVLDLTYECFCDIVPYMHHLVHLAALLLSEHPTGAHDTTASSLTSADVSPLGTLKHTQNFFTSCLNTFTGRAEFTNGPLPLRLEVLRLLRRQCSDSVGIKPFYT